MLAAKQSAEVPEEHEHGRPLGPRVAEPPGSARGVGQYQRAEPSHVHRRTLPLIARCQRNAFYFRAMPMPTDVGVVDLMMSLPTDDRRVDVYRSIRKQTRDAESQSMKFPAGYMFKDVPDVPETDDPVGFLLKEMDRFGIEKALLGVAFGYPATVEAVQRHGDRLLGCIQVDPNKGMDGVRELVRAREEVGVVAASAFPCGYDPQVPINDKRFFPLYAKCVELDIPIFVNSGVPGPRVPTAAQKTELLDEVCWFFPELTIVTRHGCEPWTDLAVSLMVKWPNLYYSTSAIAPKYYSPAIVHYANTRGADKVLYAGYYPMGLSLDRIFSELPDVPFRDHVWPKFLRENALRVLKLDG
jgi:predicted TIM-barrel fold metal-dependent hydrolase